MILSVFSGNVACLVVSMYVMLSVDIHVFGGFYRESQFVSLDLVFYSSLLCVVLLLLQTYSLPRTGGSTPRYVFVLIKWFPEHLIDDVIL